MISTRHTHIYTRFLYDPSRRLLLLCCRYRAHPFYLTVHSCMPRTSAVCITASLAAAIIRNPCQSAGILPAFVGTRRGEPRSCLPSLLCSAGRAVCPAGSAPAGGPLCVPEGGRGRVRWLVGTGEGASNLGSGRLLLEGVRAGVGGRSEQEFSLSTSSGPAAGHTAGQRGRTKWVNT